MQKVTQIDMGVIKPEIEIVLDERDIKSFAITGNDDLVFLDVRSEIVTVLPPHISFNHLAVVKRDCGDFVEVPI